ncbi:hypothetical protein [Pseudooceanicola marinus]|uniref:hypothetical protein n=1 Tax=Pseudooceanicola marinus TaxID=396013 RepID=UPI001C9872D6|nr:hypothetical protein [Pseudooceanicola marinus]MBY5973441.1 hypothetical protein [Ferrimonas balearica]MCA1336315.1 hypothetical protein [Pseudooceanicola marinus]
MLLKIVFLFLVGMAVLAMFGKLSLLRKLGSDVLKPARRVSATCPDCGRHRIGKGPCPCKTGTENRKGS